MAFEWISLLVQKKSPLDFFEGYLKLGGTLLVAQLVEALRYKPEGRGFDCR